jgi:hypothetical protein
VAREQDGGALRQHARKEYARSIRLQRTVNADVASLHDQPVAEMVDNARRPHRALAEVRRSLMRRMTTVIDVDLAKYFDNVRHDVLLGKIARRVQDPKVLHLVKLIIKAGGKKGLPQGGPFSPLAANI